MIKSMTGYGSAKGEVHAVAVTAELKSVNNRYLDVSVHLPKNCLFAETAVRATVANFIGRGKVDVFITVDTSATEDVVIQVNEGLAAAYVNAVHEASRRYGLADDMTALQLLSLPGVVSNDKTDMDRDILTEAIVTVLLQALKELNAMREREGGKLLEDIAERLRKLTDMVAAVERRSPETLLEYRAKLLEKMKAVLSEAAIDENRVLQEAAIYADKVAVDEETVRLRSHITQFQQLLEDASPVGRRMDFLLQEMNRETNTIGSKCSDGTIARTVIDMKAELEKIREQIQNIE